MKYPIIWAILIYQRVAPTSLRERCIFKKSCSNYVLDGAREKGAFEAIKRLRERMRKCKGGYRKIDTSLAKAETEPLVRLVDGSVLEWHEVSEKVKAEFE